MARAQQPVRAELFDPLLTADEVVAWLRQPKQTLYAWRARGLGPPGLKVAATCGIGAATSRHGWPSTPMWPKTGQSYTWHARRYHCCSGSTGTFPMFSCAAQRGVARMPFGPTGPQTQLAEPSLQPAYVATNRAPTAGPTC
jgi:hypothetical protein